MRIALVGFGACAWASIAVAGCGGRARIDVAEFFAGALAAPKGAS